MRSYEGRLSAALAIALALTTSACADGDQAGGGSDAATYRNVVADVAGRTPVQTIQVLTRTAAEDPRWFEQARLIVESWQRAGIPAELQAVRGAEVGRRAFMSKDFDATLLVYAPMADRIDPDNILSRFTSARAGVSGSNISGYRNAAYDALYDAQQVATNETDRVAAVKRAQKLLYEQQPVRPFAYPVVAGAYRSDRWDGIRQALGYPVFNIWNSIGATPKTGKRTLVVGTISESLTLNPVALETPSAQLLLSHIYDSLVRIGPEGELRDWAAESVKVDGARVTAKLRPGMRFSDGHPVTASDVAFSVRYLIDKKSPLFAPKLAAVRDVRATGDSVEITLTRPSQSFVATALSQVPILPEHIWRKVAHPEKFVNDNPVGSGPFVFAGRKLGAEIRFTANKRHFSAPRIDGLVMIVLGGFDAEVGGLAQGDLDMLGDVQNVAQLASVRGKSGITVLSAESIGWAGLHYNMRKEPFDDRHFRRALSLLIPVRDIIDVVFDGQGEPAGSPIAASLTKWHDASLQPFPYDLPAAMKELREAGYVFDRHGVLYYPAAREDKRLRDNDLPS
ncbi:ABC transporter substrate-binding protein [Sphaerisporangium sp. NPDC049002]|uniref:ABC transporter substrate-binding protein n=1 Tax=unclassified Sphaerisporangium TaxID=2630420 RepID=UPI00340ABB0B